MEEDYTIVVNAHGKITSSFDVPMCMVCHIIGRGGKMLRNIQMRTNSHIYISSNGRIEITGDTEELVAWTRSDILKIVFERRVDSKATHIVSIPLVSQSTTEMLEWFKGEILKDPPAGLPEFTFQVPHKLHLTLLVFTLLDDRELIIAREAFYKCCADIVPKLFPKTKKYEIVVQGLCVMGPDPSSVRALYGKVQMVNSSENENLHEMVDRITECCHKTGFISKKQIKVQLAARILHSSHGGEGDVQEAFDASKLLEKYRNVYLGTANFDSLHLSILGTADGHYYEAASVFKV